MDVIEENEKKFKCDQCSESFKRNFSLTLHRTVLHNTVKKLECKESGKVYDLQNVMSHPQDNISESSKYH